MSGPIRAGCGALLEGRGPDVDDAAVRALIAGCPSLRTLEVCGSRALEGRWGADKADRDAAPITRLRRLALAQCPVGTNWQRTIYTYTLST